ncbi:MAG: transcriptional regulator, partial [Oscillospiraceae bacterium]|nr:transcriptional regulator [Oscillospiraceae bacterium]
SVIDGVARKDFWDYPKDAIREALLNAIIHRDYGFSGSIIINVNDSRMEFISIGGLLPGISTDDIRNGISQLRNKNLAETFLRLNFIEAYGTGIRRIFALYDDCTIQPEIDVTPNSFKLTLPNINAVEVVTPTLEVTPQMQTLLDYLESNSEISENELQSLLNIKKTRSFDLVKQMSDAGLVKVSGRGVNRRIELIVN